MFARTFAAILIAACVAAPLAGQVKPEERKPEGDPPIRGVSLKLPVAGTADPEFEAAKEKAIDTFLKGELDEALKQFDALVAKNLRDDELLAYRAAIYLEKREFAKADTDLKAALELNPNSMLGYHNRGYGKWLRADYPGAVADYSSAIAVGIARHARRALTGSGLAGMYQNRGLAYEDMGDLDRAAIDFTRCIQLHPERSAYHVNRALVYLKRGMNSEAISDLDEALFLDPLNAQTRVNRAWASYLVDDFDAAVREYTRALYLKPDYVNALVGRGNAYVARSGLAEATADFESALKLRPKLASGHSGLGLVAAQRGNWRAAETHYRDAVACDANDTNCLRGLAIALWKQGRTADALEHYRTACQRAPGNATLWLELGRLCAETGLAEDALVALNRALEAAPGHAAARALRASVHVSRGEFLLAADDLRQAVKADPANAALRVELAACYARRPKATAADVQAGLEQVALAVQAGARAEDLSRDERLATLRADARWAEAIKGR
ncbi:MAG: tetratricopeptide repeat protein [Planctomycetes bacterium]|nr:tetratricopeptide repeat protein [Planctomycetota bacterium]